MPIQKMKHFGVDMPRKRILVVDNEEDQRRLLETILHRLGYSVGTVESPAGALSLTLKSATCFIQQLLEILGIVSH